MKKYIALVICVLLGLSTSAASFASPSEEYSYGCPASESMQDNSGAAINIPIGKLELEDLFLSRPDSALIQTSKKAEIIVRNSLIERSSSPEADEILLVNGKESAVIARDESKVFLINSTIQTDHGGAVSSVDGKGSGIYLYGADISASEHGYGILSDILNSVYVYESHISAAEIALISNSYGTITLGKQADDTVLSTAVRDSDTRGSRPVIAEAGRNTMVISSENLPAYWDLPEYTREDFPLCTANVTAEGAELITNLSLNKESAYTEQQQSYIGHTKGSVILIKSTNADIALAGCKLEADKNGTGYIIQSVPGNNTESLNTVPEGSTYPGIHISMKDMEVSGDIAHEDYQRDMELVFSSVKYTGEIDEYGLDHWKKAAVDEKFTDFCPDDRYDTHHGISVSLKDSSVWTVTEESVISKLEIAEGCNIYGLIYVNGVQVPAAPAVYEGNVVLLPLSAAPVTQEETSTAAVETPKETETETETQEETGTEAIETVHIHNWIRENGGNPADCEHDGGKYYYCSECGETYTEVIPAVGHDMQFGYHKTRDCLMSGYDVYKCSRCDFEEVYNFEPATGHEMELVYETDSTCTYQGQVTYQCRNCTYIETTYKPFLEHELEFTRYYYATCESWDSYEYTCKNCLVYTYWEFGDEAPTGHDFSGLMPDYDEGMQDTYHLNYCVKCGTRDYSSKEYHYGSPCVCGWN